MTAEIISSNPWATLDDLLGIEVDGVDPDARVGALAFYGRCSTEDNQDPETSLGWQRANARKFVEPLGGRVVVDFFDIGQSRSVPWERRTHGSRLLAALKDPRRTWTGVVVGEGTRCWFGNQFSLVAPKFAAYGVDLWVPELGGKFDPRNPSHKMLMSVLGGMSESERQHVQARVRAAMDAQVVNEGRHQGGRAPFGYSTVNAGLHPNPRKAAEGGHLRVLEIDPLAAEVVSRIFAEYLEGAGDRAIAGRLNVDGVACPSQRRPEQNRHRLADGWQGSQWPCVKPTSTASTSGNAQVDHSFDRPNARPLGRGARSGRSWKIPGIPVTRYSGGGPSTRSWRTRMTSRPGM